MRRVLCLGGFNQTEETLEARLHTLAKAYKNALIFDTMVGPHSLPRMTTSTLGMLTTTTTTSNTTDTTLSVSEEDGGVDETKGGAIPREEQNQQQEAGFAWFIYNRDDPCSIDWNELVGKRRPEELIGLEESIALVQKRLATHKYDIILGFSQGGAFLSLLARRMDLSSYKLIFVGAFDPVIASSTTSSPSPCPVPPLAPPHMNVKTKEEQEVEPKEGEEESTGTDDSSSSQMTTPFQRTRSLHVMGTGDEIIKQEWSMRLAKMCSDPLIMIHKGRHVLPRIPKETMAKLLHQ